jgi:hypothetical protein
LAIEVSFGEDRLDVKVDRVIRVSMFPNGVGHVSRDVGNGTIIGG